MTMRRQDNREGAPVSLHRSPRHPRLAGCCPSGCLGRVEAELHSLRGLSILGAGPRCGPRGPTKHHVPSGIGASKAELSAKAKVILI